MIGLFQVSVLILLALHVRPSHQGVDWPTNYYVEGVLILPYAEIREPFTAYYDVDRNRSRVDYYGDLVLTLQRGDVINEEADLEGISYKIAYNVDSAGNPGRVCFQVNGSDLSPITPQSVLPDLIMFNYLGNQPCPAFGEEIATEKTCEYWKYVVVNEEKRNKYEFWLQRDSQGNAIPVHYNMEGMNTLFGSHYDKYQISYRNFRPNIVDDGAFQVTLNVSCQAFPGPGSQISHLHNPMSEFIGDEASRHSKFERSFDHFKQHHNKKYPSRSEEEQRKIHFRHNHRFIESHNRKNIHYKLKINHLADRSDSELRILRGRLNSKIENNGGQPFVKLSDTKPPSSLDWRLAGAVTPVKDQAVCGSCWSFGTVGTIEGVYFVKTGELVKLSEQQLIDCSWNQGDNGCDGGEDFRAYNYIMKAGGLSLDEEYGSYLGQDGKCHDRGTPKTVKLSGFVNVTSNDSEALELALFKNGPVTVAIDASQKTFSFYSHGIYYDDNCGNKPDDLDHQVLAVGYGTLYNQKYWLIKNSWSTYWGNDGYILISQKNNNCGVMTSPTYPIISDN